MESILVKPFETVTLNRDNWNDGVTYQSGQKYVAEYHKDIQKWFVKIDNGGLYFPQDRLNELFMQYVHANERKQKYDVLFCKCGHVHFLDYKQLQKICEEGKEVVHVCNNCGIILRIGLENNVNGSGKTWYRIEFRNNQMSADKFGLLLSNEGYEVPMQNGSNKVDTKRLLISIHDDEKLRALSSYRVYNINWTDTPYQQ